MFNDARRPAVVTSPAHDMFQYMFDSLDVVSSFYQPSAKGIGRWHLEIAHFGTQQAQANLDLTRRLMRCTSPFEAMAETMNYWQRLSQQFGQAGQNFAAAAAKAVQPPEAFTGAFEALPLPARKARDTIFVPDRDEPELPFERKVA